MPDALGPDLISEFTLPSARGGRKAEAALEVEIVRELVAEDLPDLVSPPALDTSVGALSVPRQLKAQHHRLAQLLATGKSKGEISLITGYSPSYISVLQTGPDFQELIEYYSTQRQLAFASAQERAGALGLTAIEELQSRLDSEPEKWTNGQLMDLVETTAKVGVPGGSGGGASGPVNIQVNFVQPASAPDGASGPLIELEVSKP